MNFIKVHMDKERLVVFFMLLIAGLQNILE